MQLFFDPNKNFAFILICFARFSGQKQAKLKMLAIWPVKAPLVNFGNLSTNGVGVPFVAAWRPISGLWPWGPLFIRVCEWFGVLFQFFRDIGAHFDSSAYFYPICGGMRLQWKSVLGREGVGGYFEKAAFGIFQKPPGEIIF
jgi:hypothetical protein